MLDEIFSKKFTLGEGVYFTEAKLDLPVLFKKEQKLKKKKVFLNWQ